MRPAGDVRDEMTSDCFDEAFDRLLAGRPVSAEAALLMAFTDAVRADATSPGRPSPQLAQLFADGLPSAPAADVRTAAIPAPTRPAGRRRRRAGRGILVAAVVKFASAGAFAQAATGVGIVLASVTGAGSAGVLPDPIQGSVSTVLEAVTPFELPDSADGASATDEEPAEAEATTETGRVPQDGGSPTGGPAGFGQSVSDEARAGRVDGRSVSDQARNDHRPPVPATEQPTTERRAPAEHAPGQAENRRPATVPATPASPAKAEPGRP
jgi:hypothetical protein